MTYSTFAKATATAATAFSEAPISSAVSTTTATLPQLLLCIEGIAAHRQSVQQLVVRMRFIHLLRDALCQLCFVLVRLVENNVCDAALASPARTPDSVRVGLKALLSVETYHGADASDI